MHLLKYTIALAFTLFLVGCGGSGNQSEVIAGTETNSIITEAGIEAGATSSGTGDTNNRITFAWDPPDNPGYGNNITLTGYRLYYGVAADQLTNFVDIEPGLTSYTFTSEQNNINPDQPLFVAITAINNRGLESRISNLTGN